MLKRKYVLKQSRHGGGEFWKHKHCIRHYRLHHTALFVSARRVVEEATDGYDRGSVPYW